MKFFEGDVEIEAAIGGPLLESGAEIVEVEREVDGFVKGALTNEAVSSSSAPQPASRGPHCGDHHPERDLGIA